VSATESGGIVVLLSGGIDSVTALYHALSEAPVAAALSFDYGSRHNHRELPLARMHCARNGIRHASVPLDFIAREFRSSLLKGGAEIPEDPYDEDSMRSTVVPFRNGIMLSIAAGFAASVGADAVLIGAHGGDHAIYPDCREDFMRPMAAAMRAGTYEKIVLQRPFIDWSKADIVRRGAELGIDYRETWSCYKGGELHCGLCGTCRERRAAFAAAGITDPTEYV
jgi:7-cyano-7-deazaguanine synthase